MTYCPTCGRNPCRSPGFCAECAKTDAGEIRSILDDVHAFLGRFVIYPSKEAHDAHVLWIAHTHCMDAWESTPRIAFLSPEPKSGKTRALEISELLVPNAVEAVNMSPAYIFRKIGDENGLPTLLHDEIDTLFGPKAKENEDIRGLYNAGHRRGAVVGRCVVHGRVHAVEGNKLRDQLAVWAAGAVKEMTEARPVMPDGVEDRDADMWEPLLAIADAAGEHWPKRARVAAVTLVAAAADREPSLGIRLLSDLRDIFGQAEQMTTAVVLERLTKLPEAPWNELKGKPLNDRGLAVRLRQYGVKSRTLNLGGESRSKGYVREDLHDVWKRYLAPAPPSPEGSVTSVTSGTSLDFQGSKVTDVTGNEGYGTDEGGEKSTEKSTAVADVTDVTLVAGYRGDAFPELPDCLRRAPKSNGQPRLCDNCGAPGDLNPWNWPNRPDGIVLHSSCEAPWFDSEGRGNESQ